MANSDYPTSIQVAHLREHRSGRATGRPCAAIFCLSITAYVNSNICSGGQDRGAIHGVAAPAFNLAHTNDTIWRSHLRLLKADMAAVMTAGGSVCSAASIACRGCWGARGCKLNTLLALTLLLSHLCPPTCPPLLPSTSASSLVNRADISSSVSYLSPPSALMKVRPRHASARDRLLPLSSVASISLYTYIFP